MKAGNFSNRQKVNKPRALSTIASKYHLRLERTFLRGNRLCAICSLL